MEFSEGKIHIFIDTSTVENLSFDLDRGFFQQILSADEVIAHTTTITLRELRGRVDHLIQQTRKIARRTSSIEWKETSLFMRAYAECCAYTHDGDGVNLKALTELYLNGTPPFKRKPEEFKAAIAALSLHVWAKANDKIIYIISDDGDWDDIHESCENLHKATLGSIIGELYKIHKQRDLVDADKAQSAADDADEKFLEALRGRQSFWF